MPKLELPESKILLERLRRYYQNAEQELLNTIFYQRGRGLIDYAQAAAVERVQRILTQLQNDCWTYVPRLIELSFYENHPEAARLFEPAGKHRVGYENALVLTGEQTAIVSTLTANLMGELLQASETATASSHTAIGRLSADGYRRAGLSAVATMEAAGRGPQQGVARMIASLRAEGITAFTDRAGRHWSLSHYCNMVTRTTSRQAQNAALLTRDPEQDLYQITSNGTTCPVCAPLEGRVYSKSGRDPDYPPLSAAFEKVHPSGPDTLENSYLNLHPNCLHTLRPYSLVGLTAEGIERDKRFSSFQTNPPDRDPRSTAQMIAYQKQQAGRRKFLAMLREYQQYRAVLGDQVPKTAQTYLQHKMAGDETYENWKALYSRLS